ncbi:universal stress protein [Zunongwangia sp.]|uniref:universal stress protein n=1 Tax=Zunongwangia sp. TaxID=1965325 RepID=UPI003AA81744
MKTILVPVDFSKASINAFKYAVEFASKDAIQIFVIHIKETEEDDEKEIQSKIDELQETVCKRPLEISTIIKAGDLNEEMIKIQKREKIDLIIMGTKGARVRTKNMNSKTSEFVHIADCPVLVIPENVEDFKLDTILLTLGKEKIVDTNALYTLLDVARHFGAEVHILTVSKDDDFYAKTHESNENTLKYFLEIFYSHHSFFESDDIVEGIIQYLGKHDIDMLAILPNTHAKNGSASEGKLTKLLSLHTTKPLLVLD